MLIVNRCRESEKFRVLENRIRFRPPEYHNIEHLLSLRPISFRIHV